MIQLYQSIPTTGPSSIPTDEDGNAKVSKNYKVYFIALVALSAFLLLPVKPSLSLNSLTELAMDSAEDSWPESLESQVPFFLFRDLDRARRPTNTDEALEQGWQKSGEPCVPSLGEPWLMKVERSAEYPVTFYFTPSIIQDHWICIIFPKLSKCTDTPGKLSGIEVDYYGYVEPTMIARENNEKAFFSGPKQSNDGEYYSLAVALRNSKTQDLCSTVATLNPQGKYLAVAPDLANIVLPVKESNKLREKWKKGACLPQMGFHWARDLVGGSDLTYQAENLMPVISMYDPADGKLTGIFFIGTDQKSNYPIDDPGCGNPLAPTHPPQCLEGVNLWDLHGFSEENKPRFYFCQNFCGPCEFSGSPDGRYSVMHFMFKKDVTSIECIGSDKGFGFYCPDGDYPPLTSQ